MIWQDLVNPYGSCIKYMDLVVVLLFRVFLKHQAVALASDWMHMGLRLFLL